jgi:uncharacterized metal-binding protein YceD (DUF177 family)
MPELISHAPDNPEFARVIELRQIRELEAFPFAIAPTGSEAAALARLLGVQAVRRLKFAGRLARSAGGAWQLDAELGASVVQTCVVTLEPVTTRIDQPVRRRFVPQHSSRSAELVVSPDEDDETEPLEERIDLGLVAIEALALALPPYPRRPGVSLDQAFGHLAPARPDESETKPFAALAALRGKLGNGS